MAGTRSSTAEQRLTFICNVCGAEVRSLALQDLDREGGACPKCGAVVRLRALAYLVGRALFQKAAPVPQWPKRPKLRGIGVSDWPKFEKIYASKFSYTNTQFDREIFAENLFLDVTDPGLEFVGTCDVVSCSEVLEHVEPPVQDAFDGLYSMLRPGGSLILTVPYIFGRTIEHFPELHDWKLVPNGDKRKLVNITSDGRRQEFTELCFHGGGSSVLEMRVFGLDDLERHLRDAGFMGVRIMDENPLEFGIYWPQPWSRPIVARKPDDSENYP